MIRNSSVVMTTDNFKCPKCGSEMNLRHQTKGYPYGISTKHKDRAWIRKCVNQKCGHSEKVKE